jgi:hypothetical protein
MLPTQRQYKAQLPKSKIARRCRFRVPDIQDSDGSVSMMRFDGIDCTQSTCIIVRLVFSPIDSDMALTTPGVSRRMRIPHFFKRQVESTQSSPLE